MKPGCKTILAILLPAAAWAADVTATRFKENPLITVNTSPSLGDNVNGPTVIRVPDWVQRPLGRYYMYFAHHKGQYIRLAYADSLHGPWKIYEPGVMQVSETAFFRLQPDPDPAPPGVYTHVASPEIYVDQSAKRIILWFHGLWTEGQRWPAPLPEARAWLRDHGYAQYTQSAVSADGIHFETRPAITREPYLRVFQHGGEFYGIVRLGHLLRGMDPLSSFAIGPDPFRDGPHSGKVRHVALLPRGNKLDVFLSVIGNAPNRFSTPPFPSTETGASGKPRDTKPFFLPTPPMNVPISPWPLPKSAKSMALPASSATRLSTLKATKPTCSIPSAESKAWQQPRSRNKP
jgi:hypothetical protein